MKKPAFLVDAFTTKMFKGNPAGVCLFEQALPAEQCIQIAAEFNASNTGFPVPAEEGKDFRTASIFDLRWFTPTTEVPLCGHATLATSHVLLNGIGNINSTLTFRTFSGELIVQKGEAGAIEMNFPQYKVQSMKVEHHENQFLDEFPVIEEPFPLKDFLNAMIPTEYPITGVLYAPVAKILIIVLDGILSRAEFERIERNTELIKENSDEEHIRGVLLTMAPKNEVEQGFVDENDAPFDYLCRYFAPYYGLVEDPATGSAQCALAPFWSRILKKSEFYALQAYPGRGAQFRLKLEDGGRLSIIGNSVTVLSGQINID
ncbi:unnamed protein product, partial [Mesorhabditis spiculigera]